MYRGSSNVQIVAVCPSYKLFYFVFSTVPQTENVVNIPLSK